MESLLNYLALKKNDVVLLYLTVPLKVRMQSINIVQLVKSDGSKVSNVESSASTMTIHRAFEYRSRMQFAWLQLNAASHMIPSVLSYCVVKHITSI